MSTGFIFKPRMVGFVCNWCCYGGADLCGVSRFQYPPYIRLIRVMCSGRVDPAHILRAFSRGADGVFIGGCWPGECHYNTEGNYDALGMVHLLKKLLKHIGVNPERLRLEWVSASEGIRFANVMNELSNKIEKLGPFCKGEGIDEQITQFKLEALTNILPYIKLVERESLRVRLETEKEYEDFFKKADADSIFRDLILDKLALSEIMLLLREGPLANEEISGRLGLNPSEVARHLTNSIRQGLVRFNESQKVVLPPKAIPSGNMNHY